MRHTAYSRCALLGAYQAWRLEDGMEDKDHNFVKTARNLVIGCFIDRESNSNMIFWV